MAIAGFGDIAEQLRRSTVLIHAGGRGNGSGVIWSSEGMIVTNAHVVHGPNVCVQLWDGREFEAAVTARDPRRDLAALRINANSLPAACPADSSELRPGELAIAIGNPLGFVGALTTGVIHAIGPLHALGSQTWVQSSVRLAPGNSGGPLADARGYVIGVNTMVAGRLALAIPSNAVRDFLRPDRAVRGSVLLSIPCACLARMATSSDWSCWKSSLAARLPWRRSWPGTSCWARRKSLFNRSTILPKRCMDKASACCVSNCSAATTHESGGSPCS